MRSCNSIRQGKKKDRDRSLRAAEDHQVTDSFERFLNELIVLGVVKACESLICEAIR